MPLFLSERSESLKKLAEKISREFGHFYLGTEHLLWAMIHSEAWIVPLFESAGIKEDAVQEKMLEITGRGDSEALWDGIITTPRFKKVLRMAEGEAESVKSAKVEPVHIFTAVLKEGRGIPARVLKDMDVDIEALRQETLRLTAEDNPPVGIEVPIMGKGIPLGVQASPKGKKPPTLLQRFSRELVSLAREGKIDPVVGRQDEIRRALQILTRKSKNNPVLIGEAGVGKTAVVYGLALRIASGNVPDMMKNKKIYDINLSSIVAGTRHRGEFEERLQKIIEELVHFPDAILFIDEIHTIVGAGDVKGGMDAGNILKPFLAKGEFPCIGATTTDEYRRYIEADAALERRFQPVLVNEPSEEDSLEILRGLKERYEKHHGVKFKDSALLAAVKMSVRFLPDRHLPDKAIDLIDEAAAKIKTKSVSVEAGKEVFAEVDEEVIAEVVSLWTGIPVSKLTQEESQRLLDMEELLRKRLVGQDEAITKAAQTIRMVRMGLGNPRRPSGVFLFLGPTGVGKTEMAKALAEFLFGSERDMVRLDMSEYMEKHSISRLIGSPPGYIGHEEEGQLTKAVRTKPYSVVLLDEIEKAHWEVFDLFLQVFDDGRLTDSKGRTVNFTNTIIIMTSNLGTSSVDEQGNVTVRDMSKPEVREEIMNAVRKSFRPEFLNRIDEIVLFKPLTEEDIEKIFQINFDDLEKRVKERGAVLEVSDEARRFLIKSGFHPSYGARPLKRAIETYLAKPLASEMLKFPDVQGKIFKAVLQDGKIIFEEMKLE
ncbi:MAG: ATP-dependent Clp protease ATP-binding subunit [Firmicutes bacterium]|nr:ATP-dependent Clp protease ATP-binding subunit [Bacillota bacterium]